MTPPGRTMAAADSSDSRPGRAEKPSRPSSGNRQRLGEGVVCGAAVTSALLLAGPALLPGSLLSLDLVVTPHVGFPEAILGIGGEVARRVPLGALFAGLGAVVGDPIAAKGLLVAFVAVAFAGMARLTRPAPLVTRLAAAGIYALGPFVATRIGAGHWAIVAAMAIFPWALPNLFAPGSHLPRTFLWLTAAALTGVFGGLVASLIAIVGASFEERRRIGVVVGAAVTAQLPWLVPALLLQGNGLDVAGGEHFATTSEGPLGVVGALFAQHGFWRGASQVGGQAGTGLVLIGVGLFTLALVGHRDLPSRHREPLAVIGGLGFVAAAAPALPGLDWLHAQITSLTPFSPLREPQRFLALFLLWSAPAGALGAVRLGRSDPGLRFGGLSFFAAAAVVLAVPGMWGVEGRLEPVEFPQAWDQAREVVKSEPGSTLALPWHEYLDLEFADGRRVLNALPDFLPGDVVSSTDPEITGETFQESVDEREGVVGALLPSMKSGVAVADQLADLGIRWVVLLHEADWRDYDGLADDPGLRPVIRSDSLDLFEVEGVIASDTPFDPDRSAWRVLVALTAYIVLVGLVFVCLRRLRGRAS